MPECRAAMTALGMAVIWLRAEPEVLARRFASPDRHHPEYGRSPEAFLADQAARRDLLFASLHPIVIDVDAIDPDEVAARALEALG